MITPFQFTTRLWNKAQEQYQAQNIGSADAVPLVIEIISGAASQSINITQGAAGTVESAGVTGAAAQSVTVSQSADGTVLIQGAAAQSVVVSQTADGTVTAGSSAGDAAQTVTITQSAAGTVSGGTVAETPTALATASGGVGFTSDRPVPPKHLTAMVFSNDPPEDQKRDERDLADALTPAEDGTSALPSSAPLSQDAAKAIAAGVVGEVAVAPLPPMPELIAGNDDEEAMMIILALAA